MRAVLIASLLLPPRPWRRRTPTLCRTRPPLSRPGPNLDVVQQNCSGCHSADYISTQPRHLPNPQAFWQAEVTKMKGPYGASIDAADVPKIVDYLVQTYGQ